MADPDPKDPVPEPTPTPTPSADPPKGAEPAPAPTPEPTSEPEPKPTDWRDRRIAQLTARLREEEAKNKAKPADAPPTPSAPTAGTYDDAEVERRADLKAATRAFNDKCNEVAQQGRLAFPDFEAKITSLRQLVDPNDATSAAAYNSFLAAAIETGDAPRLLHELGSNMNEASRILALPPIKMAVELARLAGAKPDTTGTRAPKPATPVRGTGAGNASIDPTDPERSDTLATDEWMRRREAQIKERGEPFARRRA